MFNIKETLKLIIRRKQQTNMETNLPDAKVPYLTLRKQLKAEIKQLTEDYIKAGGASLGDTSYLNLRAKHIAYSMFKGKRFDEVERSWKHPDSWINKSVKKRAEELYAKYQDKVDRTVSDDYKQSLRAINP